MIYYKKNNFDDILQKNNFKNISMFCLLHDMIRNSNIINKANNHLSPFKSMNTIKTTTYDVVHPGPGLGQIQKYIHDFKV
jgi:hypothetical protein